MVFQSKEIFLLPALLIFVVGESAVEEKGRNESIPDYDICTLYDHSKSLNRLLFQKNYKPLVVIIADEFIDGINRVRNITQSKRILPNYLIKVNPSLFEFHQIISEHFYLYEAKNVYYFVYPINILDNVFTTYFQKILLNDQLGVIFDFVDVIKEYPFFKDILIPLNPSYTNYTLTEYVKQKLQSGESFSELIKLRDQLFGGEKSYVAHYAFNNDDLCDSIGFKSNLDNDRILMYFNSLLQQIQNNGNNTLTTVNNTSKRTTAAERSLTCFQSTKLKVIHKSFIKDTIDECPQTEFQIGVDYLNWINSTISSLTSIDNSFGDICKNDHEIDILKLFCFIKDLSDVTSYNISAWIDTLKQLVVKPLTNLLKLFNNLIFLYKQKYFMKSEIFILELYNLYDKISQDVNLNEDVKPTLKLFFFSILYQGKNSCFTSFLNNPCSIYKYWKTIDDLVPKMEYKRLIIIVADDMLTGISKFEHIEGSRIVPKLKRETLHYTKQFVHDEIMKHIHLYQFKDTYFYVYPMRTDRHHNALITYFEFKMIDDYSKVLFYFVNCSNYFPSIPFYSDGYNDLFILSPPYNCELLTTKCTNRFLNLRYFIYLYQKFYSRYSKYFSKHAMFYNKLPKFTSNHYAAFIGNDSIENSQKFNDFLKEQQSSNTSKNLFEILPCPNMWTLNKRIDIDFSMTKMIHFSNLRNTISSAYKNITLRNDMDNTNLKYFCSNTNIFLFINLFCFLKQNYIEGMEKVHNNSLDFMSVKNNVENQKRDISEYLFKALQWMNRLKMLDYSDYMNNDTRIKNELQNLYSSGQIKILLNGVDLFDKIYLLVREEKIYFECQQDRFNCLVP